jgi:hypothetical protein
MESSQEFFGLAIPALSWRLLTSTAVWRDDVLICPSNRNGGVSELIKLSDGWSRMHDSIYNKILESWQAFACGILLQPTLTLHDVKTDIDLFNGILLVKRWFLKVALKNGYPDKDDCWILPQLDLAIRQLKMYSKWAAYYSVMSPDLTDRPGLASALPGWNHSEQMLSFPFFAGKLAYLAKPWLMDSSLLNCDSMLQVASTGRAFPPPFKEIAEKFAFETLETLGTDVPVSQQIVDLVEEACFKEAAFMNTHTLPTKASHMSVSTSACYERTQEELGAAGELVDQISPFICQDVYPLVKDAKDRGALCFYDCFGRVIFDKATVEIVTAHGRLGMSTPLYAYAYVSNDQLLREYRRGISEGRAIEAFKEFCFGGFLGESTIYSVMTQDGTKDLSGIKFSELIGELVLLWASGQMLHHGRFAKAPINGGLFTDDRDDISTPSYLVPLWTSDGPGLQKPVMWEHDRGRPFQVRFFALPEHGWKVRPLGCGQLAMNLIQSVMRNSIYHPLEADPRTGGGFKSAHAVWDFFKFLNRNGRDLTGYSSVNTDLTAATNRTPRLVVRAIWRGIRRGFCIGDNNPIGVFWDVHDVAHHLTYKGKIYTHMCGSLMGEPISFIGLTFYTLTMNRLSSSMLAAQVDELVDLRSDQVIEGPLDSFDLVIGDDDTRVSRDAIPLGRLLRKVQIATNAKPSAGKDSISRVLCSIAENNIWLSGGQAIFIDLIKARLLTSSISEHSDHRASVIGKGVSLSESIDFHLDSKENSTFPRQFAFYAWLRNFEKKYSKKAWDSLKSIPVGLPASCGGLRLPIMTWDLARLSYKTELDLLWHWIHHESFGYFFQKHREMHEMTSQVKRGMPVPSIMSLISNDMFDMPIEDKYDADTGFQPDKGYSLIAASTAARLHAIENSVEIPISPYTDRPMVKWVVEYSAKFLDIIPVSVVTDMLERTACFRKMFEEGPEKDRKTLNSYIQANRTFWQKEKKAKDPSIQDNEFTGFGDLAWKMHSRLLVFVPTQTLVGGKLLSGPSLHCNLGLKSGRAHTGLVWSENLTVALVSFLSQMGQEPDVHT